MIGNIVNLIKKGNKRSVKVKKNIIAAFGIKGGAVLIGLIKVPIILAYLNVEKYGVWLTIASIVDWVQYFDLGLGHGLRNKFAESLAKGDKERAKQLVSTTYYYITLIFGILGFLLVPIVFFLDWQQILNTTIVSQYELCLSVAVVLIMFILRFILYQISIILKADQRPALSDVFLPIASVITLVLVFLLKYISNDSLFLACVAISVPPVLVLLCANIYFFNKEYKEYRPSLANVNRDLFKDTFVLGIKFFVVQICALVMFASSNIILTQIVNPSEVTLYNISRQYFNMPFMIFGIILTPIWSAVTEAYIKVEYTWIKNVMKKLLYVGILFSIGEILMLVISPWMYKIWLGSEVLIPFSLSIVMAIQFIFFLLGSPFAYFINGVGKLSLSIKVGYLQIVLFLPAAIFLTKQWGALGLVLSMILINSLIQIVIIPLQYKRIINKTANGIWNK